MNTLSKKNCTALREVFEFEFITFENIGIDEHKPINIKIELTIDYRQEIFYMDMSNVLNIETGVILLYGQNIFGNHVNKAAALKGVYTWLGEISEFAENQIKDNNAEYDILNDEKVIDIAFQFRNYIKNYFAGDGDYTTKEMWDKFRKSLLLQKLPKKQ